MKRFIPYFLIIGIILLIFSALYTFTRPAVCEVWDFSDTGQIGDTIGGITAPIINLLGAILVFISFQAQLQANDIQTRALADEKINNQKKGQLEKIMLSFDEIKKQLNSIEFIIEHPGKVISANEFSPSVYVTYTGLNAINEYVLRIENRNEGPIGRYSGQVYNTFGVALTFQFILNAICDLLERIEYKVTDIDDQDFLTKELTLYYNGFLKKFTKRLIDCYEKPHEAIRELAEIKEKIEKKIGA